MFVIANLLIAIANVLNFAITIVWWLIIIRALISWVNPDPFNPIVQFLYKSTDPILYPFQRIVPPYRLGIDISPIFAILTLMFLRYFLVNSLFDIVRHIRLAG